MILFYVNTIFYQELVYDKNIFGNIIRARVFTNITHCALVSKIYQVKNLCDRIIEKLFDILIYRLCVIRTKKFKVFPNSNYFFCVQLLVFVDIKITCTINEASDLCTIESTKAWFS